MWKRFDVIFALKSPLHIGYLPSSGSVLSPIRYYVPGKNLWGAITMRATENFFDNPDGANYLEIGNQIKNNFRFMYFYLYDGKAVYTPEFTDDGLKYGKSDEFTFEQRFIGSRVLAAINHNSGTAEDEKLHDFEFINHKYRDDNGNIRDTKLIGCIWIKDRDVIPTKDGGKKVETNENGIFVNGLNLIEELTLGGEQNYGCGQIELESINKERFPIEDVEDNDDIIKINIKKGEPILSHLKYDANITFQGDVELIGGREYQEKSERYQKPGANIVQPSYYFSPGTKLLSVEGKKFVLEWNGIIKVV